MKKAIILLIICCLFILKGNTQNIKITASNQALNEILIELRDTYDAEFSFNDTELAKYNVSVRKSFQSIDEALNFLFKDLPLIYEKRGGVYVIWTKKVVKPDLFVQEKEKKRVYRFTGNVIAYKNGEALPFSVIAINGTGHETDQNGNFSYSSTADSIFTLQISHLGYYIKDTIVWAGYNKTFELIPSVQDLEEIIITDKIIETFSENGEEAGKIKLNHMITKYLPGSSDNSVFNLLRLQPGIMASAESTNDLIIWGSYQGQSQVLFDGFTLFGLKNFNDNISAVNPFMVQHMQILKAGYDTNYGGRVGGIVELNGKNGRVQSPSVDLSVSNFTVNGLIQLPVTKNSSLQIAGRKTYYQLYNAEDFPLLKYMNENSDSSETINNFKPDYDFMDINIKYSMRSQQGDLFYISLLGGKDQFAYDFDRTNKNWLIKKDTEEQNIQKGASVFYGKTWRNGLNTSLLATYSVLNSELFDSIQLNHISDYQTVFRKNVLTTNKTEEYKFQFKLGIPINAKHRLETGLSFIQNQTRILEDTFNITYLDEIKKGEHITLFAQDCVAKHKTRLNYGFRFNYLPYLNKFYLEPRVSFSADLSEHHTFNVAWGRYHQFVSKSSVIDDLGNYHFVWTVADNEDIPVIGATHFVSGFNFHKKGFNMNIEAYYKKTTGLSRYLRVYRLDIEDVFEGQSQSIGLDVFMKQNFKGHSFWLSYSLGETLEVFNYQIFRTYRPAPHDQRHELKLAGMIDLDPFYLSANYVYGSGFSIYNGDPDNPLYETGPYSRLDAAAVFKFSMKKIFGEVGLSVLNILNKENIKLSNFERVPADQTSTINIYNDPVPFMPTLYLKIGF